MQVLSAYEKYFKTNMADFQNNIKHFISTDIFVFKIKSLNNCCFTYRHRCVEVRVRVSHSVVSHCFL